MNHRPVDHPPLIVGGPWSATLKRWQAEGLPVGVSLSDYFGLPSGGSVSVGIETQLLPAFEEVILDETDQFVLKIDKHGVKVRNFRDESSMAEHLEYPIKGPESLPWLREKLNPDNPDRVKAGWAEAARKAQQQGSLVLCNGGTYFAFFNEYMGTERLMFTYFEQPELIHEVNDLLCRNCEKALSLALSEIKLDYVGYHEDMAYKTGSLISPDLVREFMMPYYKRVTEITGRNGVNLHYMDSDGNCWELIPLWLEAGINLMSPCEVAAGMDPVALRKAFGRELLMVGGFDKRILADSPRAIRTELDRLRPVIEDGGFIPVCDHAIPPDVSLVNITCFVETLKSMYGMQ